MTLQRMQVECGMEKPPAQVLFILVTSWLHQQMAP